MAIALSFQYEGLVSSMIKCNFSQASYISSRAFDISLLKSIYQLQRQWAQLAYAFAIDIFQCFFDISINFNLFLCFLKVFGLMSPFEFFAFQSLNFMVVVQREKKFS
ncbi:hypothetical protein TTHERM_000346449 (macronuclear) [Tetrahymena thermophila SB210]|uniref:Uncharacterized protein n=1 Tax=Tetrahymena thermophila (strain SB210) TaxID=312017 RepID=W7X8Y5_TETTS|nr:hypothetical protein TTHERM_000346449 [Tetrahymena thermophila SB210]EWS73797.1 hypothetical protein TTHERM_000346449 [Tetrahymena thermophila SB210]|eukprot:XP_012653677.1 hypothetical protein TTHERM_000346449 [Tetrahymena thermophila SB210]